MGKVFEEIRQLKETIRLKDKEIEDIKISLAGVFQEIVRLNTQNTCQDPATRRRITELANNIQYQLMYDVSIENDAKIIELPQPLNRRQLYPTIR